MIFCHLGLWSVKQRDLCNMVLYYSKKKSIMLKRLFKWCVKHT